MANTKQTSGALRPDPCPPPTAEYPGILRNHVARTTVRRLFETWADDMALLSNAAARGQISEDEFFALLDECRDRLSYYATDGELASDVARLTNLLASVEAPSGGEETAHKQDCSAPESDSGTEVAISNSKRIRKISK